MGEESTTSTTEATTTATETETYSAEDVKALRDKNKTLEKQFKDQQRAYTELTKKFEGIDIEDLRSKASKVEEAERKAAERDPAKLEEMFQRKLQKTLGEKDTEIQKRDQELEKLRKQNKTLAVTDRVLGEIGKLFNDDALRFIKREVEDRCDLDDDGNIVIRDENGEEMYRGAKPVSVKEFGELLREQYPSLAKSMSTGGGKDATPGERKPSRSRVPETMEELNRLPNAKEVWESLSYEDKKRLGKTVRLGA